MSTKKRTLLLDIIVKKNELISITNLDITDYF